MPSPRFDKLLGPLACCLLLAGAVQHGAAADEDPWCGTTGVVGDVQKSTARLFNLRAIFITFPDVVGASGNSLVPDYAGEMTEQFTDFLHVLSLGSHVVDFQVVRRPGADSTRAWVMSRNRDEYVALEIIQQELQGMLPEAWDDDVDLPIYFFAAKPTCCGSMGLSHGRLTELDSYIFIRYGDVIGSGYVLHSPWLVKGLLVHEYGHQLGVGHLPDGTSGEADWCSGGYWACYGAMERHLFTGCDGWQEYDGFVPYHVFNLIRFGWIRPRVLRASEDAVELGDVRRTGDVLKIPVNSTDASEYFLVENHQMNSYDKILHGRGLLIWHIREKPHTVVRCDALSTTEAHIIDLEHQSGMWRGQPGPILAPLWPHIADPAEGRDTLDYNPGTLPSAFYSGLTLGGSPLQGPAEFGSETNPASLVYIESATNRRDPQLDPSGVEIRCIEAIPDPEAPGSYIMRFDVEIH